MLLAGSGGRGVIIVDMLNLSIKQFQNYAEPDVHKMRQNDIELVVGGVDVTGWVRRPRRDHFS